jgi:hypothetical protein
MKILTTALFISFLASATAIGQDTKQDNPMKDCPMHQQHIAQSHDAIVDRHGDQAMGFPHDKTTHHFRMSADGGVIEVTANAMNDQTNTQAIRSHLSQIAVMFGDGDFSTPMFVHDGIPPGVTTMKLVKLAIRYSYEEMPAGGRVRIHSTDAIAVSAIHDFLRFQIAEHRTGDTLDIAK